MDAIDDADWKLFSDLIRERFGLVFGGVRRPFLEVRIAERLGALKLSTVAEYYRYLLYHPARDLELEALKLLVTNNETYFFREAHHFSLLIDHLLPALAPELASRPLHVLSAACSSGEEAYSLAIALQEAGLQARGCTWQIDGCDLNRKRIAQAREAVYESASLRG